MTCNKCGMNIPEAGTVCPYCGAEKPSLGDSLGVLLQSTEGHMMLFLLLGLIVFIVVLVGFLM